MFYKKYRRILEFFSIMLLCTVFFIAYATLSIIRHNHFESGAFDLGIYDQAIWQYSKFKFPYNTIKGDIILGDHLTLTLPLISWLFYIWDNVQILLIFQAIWIAISSYAIYLFCKAKNFSHIHSLILSGVYISFYGIQSLIFFDFHPVAIGVGLMAWLLYFFEKGKWKLFATSTIALLLTQENMGIALFGLSLVWFFSTKKKKLAIILGIIGIFATIISFHLISHITIHKLAYVPHLPSSFSEIFQRFTDNDEKKQVLMYSFSWYLFLPALYFPSLISVFTDLAQYFITGNEYARMWSPYTHHRAILSIFLLTGTVEILLKIKNKRIHSALIWLLFINAIILQTNYNFPLGKLIIPSFWKKHPWMDDNRKLILSVNKDDAIAAQQNLVPHLSHRDKIYLIYPQHRHFDKNNSPCNKKSCWWLNFSGRPTYLLVDVHPGVWLTMTLESRDNMLSALENMEKMGVISPYIFFNDARKYKINYTALARIDEEGGQK